ncbi:MAG: hypothetical protein HY060_24520 [Proteobacteria bacterium]|nr:hypothetical protein [Pseudomonadota bacterium]
MRHLAACLIAASLLGAPGATAAETLHGADAVFRAAGVTIVWAVARHRDEAKTAVVIRVVDPAKRFAALAVEGVDPFTKQHAPRIAKRPLDGTTDITIARAGFADLPQSELHFYTASSATPALTVYYLGVPDTTPEFVEDAALQGYLAQAAR